MSQLGTKPGLVKLYLRIGEVAELVGVQPHVLRYWETEFRGAIRPQKSKKGQRVYSRQDVERLLKVKDLLRNQGFTIAGARKVLREGVLREGVLRESKSEANPAAAAQATAVQPTALQPTAVQPTAVQPTPSAMQPEVVRSLTPLRPMALVPSSAPVVAPKPAVVWAASEEASEVKPAQIEQPVQTIALSVPASLGEPAVTNPISDVAAERAPMFELVLPSAANSDRSAKRLRRALVDLRQDVLSAIKELG